MPFEKFIPSRKQRPPQASVKRTGTISIDLGFAQSVGLDKARFVTLYFDPGKRVIGLKPAEPKEEGTIRLSHRKRVSSVRAKPLFEAYGISLEQTTRVPVSFDENLQMVLVPLPAGPRRRRPRKASA
jgi:CubicO group peptidase (beta-lactamase class C family)